MSFLMSFFFFYISSFTLHMNFHSLCKKSPCLSNFYVNQTHRCNEPVGRAAYRDPPLCTFRPFGLKYSNKGPLVGCVCGGGGVPCRMSNLRNGPVACQ